MQQGLDEPSSPHAALRAHRTPHRMPKDALSAVEREHLDARGFVLLEAVLPPPQVRSLAGAARTPL